MDYQSFKNKLKEYNLTIKEFANLTGLNEKSISANWKKDNSIPKWAVSWLSNYRKAKLLELLQKELCKSNNIHKK